MPFQFVHTADIHLDSPLRTLALRDPELAELIGGATRKALVSIIDLCLAEQVDALIIAGDLYDGDQTSMKTARFLADQLRRLDEAGIQTFLIRGNHDAESRITRELTLPESVKVFGGRAEAVALTRGGLDISVQGISFAQRHAPESLLPKFRPPREGAFNIGVLHTSLGGSASHDVYAPCSAADLHGSGFDYWALGHIHERADRSRKGRDRHARQSAGARYQRGGREIGKPRHRSRRPERDDRGAADKPRGIFPRRRRFARASRTGVRRRSGSPPRWSARATSARSEHLVARLKLTGATQLAWALRADADRLVEEARAAAGAIGRTWIDKIEFACTEPTIETGPGRDDPIAELRALMDGEVVGSKALMNGLRALAEDLRVQIPADAREDLFGADAEGFARFLGGVMQEGMEDTLARLRAADAERAA